MTEFWKLFMTVLLGSGASFASLNFGFERIKDRRQRRHFALQIAFHLEGYAIECERVASDHDTADQSNGNAGKGITAVPQPPALPSTDTYRLLSPQIVNDLYAFPQRCQLAQRAADAQLEFVGHDEYQEAAEEHTVRMGMEALKIARSIREKYRLSERKLAFDDWSIEDSLESIHNKIEKRKETSRFREEARQANQKADDLTPF